MSDSYGFFDGTELVTRKPLALLPACGKCKLDKTCITPKMPVAGRGELGILIVGEAPGCVGGETLIQTAFRDKHKSPKGIPISELVGMSGFYVYSFDVKKQKLVLGKVRRVWKTGRKMTYRVIYEWSYPRAGKKVKLRDSLVVTADHPFLMKRKIKHDPFGSKHSHKGSTYMSLVDGLMIGHAIQPFHQRLVTDYYEVGISHRTMTRESRLLLAFKLQRPLTTNEECHHKDENKINEEWNNLELLTTVDHARHHAISLNPMDRPGVREKHKRAVRSEEYRANQSNCMKKHLQDPKNHERRVRQIKERANQTSKIVKAKFADPNYYWNCLQGKALSPKFCVGWAWAVRKFKERFPKHPIPSDNHRIIRIEKVGIRDVYDMEVEEHHNFAANGVFVHNSTEDSGGKPFIGPAGERLQRELRAAGVDIFRDCWVTNACACRPPGNVLPKVSIAHCRPLVIRAIEELRPSVILLLGAAPAVSVLAQLWKEGVEGIKRWAGFRIPCRKWNCWVCPTFHPSYVLRLEKAKKDPVTVMQFARDVRAACALEGRPWKSIPDDEAACRLFTDTDEAADWLAWFGRRCKRFAFDFETTTLKPDGPHADIVCCSVSDGEVAAAFPWHGKAVSVMANLLENPDFGKIGANLKFELRWCYSVGIRPHMQAGRDCDIVLTAHATDGRPGTNGVKFQSLVRLGVEDYSHAIESYLKSPGKQGNAPNNVRKVGLRDLLRYNALDSLYEYQIADQQERELTYE